MAATERVLGVILAGGENRRYGRIHKALASLGQRAILDWVVESMMPACRSVVIVANEADRYVDRGLDVRPDRVPGLGALGGVLTAVAWARESDCDAALVAACDMPFVPESLRTALALRATRDGIVVPASGSRRGFEPLCAAYGIDCEPAIRGALERGDREIVSFFGEVTVSILDAATVGQHGEESVLFLNVNRAEDRERAEKILSAEPAGRVGSNGGVAK